MDHFIYLDSDFSQVDQLVFEELVRERFPKLGLFFIYHLFSILYDNDIH